jgi:hypothetical protein
MRAQSRQSAKLFLQSSELGPPPLHPITHRRVCQVPTPLWFRGEGHTRLRERGGGQFRCGNMHILCYSMYCIYNICAVAHPFILWWSIRRNDKCKWNFRIFIRRKKRIEQKKFRLVEPLQSRCHVSPTFLTIATVSSYSNYSYTKLYKVTDHH